MILLVFLSSKAFEKINVDSTEFGLPFWLVGQCR